MTMHNEFITTPLNDNSAMRQYVRHYAPHLQQKPFVGSRHEETLVIVF